MLLCHVLCLVVIAFIVLAIAAVFVTRDEHKAIKFEFEEDERITKHDLP
jgi:hypothetical protein